MQVLVFAQPAVGVEALVGVGEGEDAEGRPVVFAQGGGDGFFAGEGELVEGEVVLFWRAISLAIFAWGRYKEGEGEV